MLHTLTVPASTAATAAPRAPSGWYSDSAPTGAITTGIASGTPTNELEMSTSPTSTNRRETRARRFNAAMFRRAVIS